MNISRYDILREDLVDVISGLVKKYDIPVDLLRLEITESAFAKSSEMIIKVVKTFQSLGFIMEIDDFGSGYSSLNTLKDVPADVLKLDMRFLEGEENSSRGGNILEAIVRMAKWLGMSIIAEGVETKQQADFLKSIGCFYIQGYYYARPMPYPEFEALAQNCIKSKPKMELDTVLFLDNDAFWNPNSIETLIFNSFVGGAGVFEYYKGKIELLRINDKYAEVLGGESFSVEQALGLDWMKFADEESRESAFASIQKAIETRAEVANETKLTGIREEGVVVYLRTAMRVIAEAGERFLFYCMIEDVTAQRETEQKLSAMKK